MAIKFHCPHCDKPLNVKDHLAGKRAACPACKNVLVIPQPPPEANVEEVAAAALADPVQEQAAPQTIDFECPQCGEPVSIGLDLAGKNAPCPHCRRIIRVPVPKEGEGGTWRERGKGLPSVARRDTEPAPEGAWTGTRRLVTREALEEAGALRPDERKALTREQKIKRVAAVAAVLLVAIAGTTWGVISWRQEKQDDLMVAALKMAETQSAREGAAAVERAAGEYYLQAQVRECADKARGHFASARNILANLPVSPERDLLLVDLALSQIDLGSSDETALRQGKRLEWKKVHEEVSQTLTRLGSTGSRIHGVRRACQKYLAAEPAQIPAAVQIGRLFTVAAGGAAPAGAAGDFWPQEGPEAMAVAGIELDRAGHKAQAEALFKMAVLPYNVPDGPSSRRPPLAPSVVALALMLDKPPPKPGKEDTDFFVIGQAEGLARKGQLAEACTFPPKTAPQTQLAALIGIAAVSPGQPEELDRAAALLEGELRGKPVSPWLVFRLVLLAAAAGQQDRANTLADLLAEPGFKGRAQVEVLRWRLSASAEPADEGLLDRIEKHPLADALARERLARHNAARESSFVQTVQAWDEAVRPFGLAGAALGLQDRGR
jgi:DNA-directed RNA polymerase subunit RPC12/RpoP